MSQEIPLLLEISDLTLINELPSNCFDTVPHFQQLLPRLFAMISLDLDVTFLGGAAAPQKLLEGLCNVGQMARIDMKTFDEGDAFPFAAFSIQGNAQRLLGGRYFLSRPAFADQLAAFRTALQVFIRRIDELGVTGHIDFEYSLI